MQDLLSLNLVEAFVEVARQGSVTAAARALGRSQPAVSHRLKLLEEQLGVTLFEKVGRSLKLTPRGERLLEECEGVLARLRAVPDLLRQEESEPSGEVCIGTFATLSRYWLLDALQEAIVQMPEVKWTVELGVAPGLFERLRQGHIDWLCLIGDYEAIEGVEVIALGEVRAALLLPAAAWPHERAPRIEELREMRLLLWRGMRDPSFELVEAHARSLGLVDHNTFEVPHIETLKELAVRGVGYTLLPDYIAREDARRGALRVFPFEAMERRFPIKAYRLGYRHATLAQRRFMELLERGEGLDG